MLPTLWALVLAFHGRPPLALVLIFAVGSFIMRTAGVIMNDLADRSLDRPLLSPAVRSPVQADSGRARPQ